MHGLDHCIKMIFRCVRNLVLRGAQQFMNILTVLLVSIIIQRTPDFTGCHHTLTVLGQAMGFFNRLLKGLLFFIQQILLCRTLLFTLDHIIKQTLGHLFMTGHRWCHWCFFDFTMFWCRRNHFGCGWRSSHHCFFNDWCRLIGLRHITVKQVL